MKKLLAFMGLLGLTLGLAACDSPADVAARNISQAADNFEITAHVLKVAIFQMNSGLTLNV